MNQQPGFLILVVIAAVIGGGWLLIQMIGSCITLVSVGLGSSPDVAVIGGTLLALAIALLILAQKDNR
jgi:hypothetical protein